MLLSLYDAPFFPDVADVPCAVCYGTTAWQTLKVLGDAFLTIGPHLTAFLVVIRTVELADEMTELFFGCDENFIF